jgi:hypothetical protein
MKKYVIKNIKYNTYFQKNIMKDFNHFVSDINEAKIFDGKREANKIFKTFNRKENYEIKGV